jgi:CRISPR/Cas system-associated protein endoribonuclease Cas2
VARCGSLDAVIKVYRIPISKDQFGQLPKEERSIVLVSGHILNQISVFMKLVRFSTGKDPANPIEANVCGMQSQLILRCLIGVPAEACV